MNLNSLRMHYEWWTCMNGRIMPFTCSYFVICRRFFIYLFFLIRSIHNVDNAMCFRWNANGAKKNSHRKIEIYYFFVVVAMYSHFTSSFRFFFPLAMFGTLFCLENSEKTVLNGTHTSRVGAGKHNRSKLKLQKIVTNEKKSANYFDSCNFN